MSQSPVDSITPENTARYLQGWKALNRLLHEDRSFSGFERNSAFLNCNGKSFADISSITGFDFLDDARAVVSVDWDFDGDLDLWTTARTAPRLRLLKNDSATNSGQWMYLKLVGNGKSINLDAIGARVELYTEGNDTPIIRTVHAGDAFLSQNTTWLHFAIPAGASISKLIVHWPGGEPQTIEGGLSAGSRYLLPAYGRPLPWSPPANRKPLIASEPKLAKPDATARIVLSGRLPLPPIYRLVGGEESEFPVDKLQGPLLVNLWASWCAPCRVELKSWADHEDKFTKAGLRVLAMHSDAQSNDSAARFLDRIGFDFETINVSTRTVRNLDLFQQSILDRWTALPVPSSFLLDSFGRVAVIYKGPVSEDQIMKDLQLLDADPFVVRDASVPFPGKWLDNPQSANPLLVNSQFLSANLIEEGVNYLKRYAATATKTGEISNKGLGDIHYISGVLEKDDGRLNAALESLQTAQKFLPDDFRIQRDLAELFIQLDQFDNAGIQVSRMKTTDPDNIEAKRLQAQVFFGKANQLHAQGKDAKAIPLYKSALSLDSRLLEAANKLSRILSSSPDTSIRNLQEAEALGKVLCRFSGNQNPDHLETLALAYFHGNKPQLAAQSLQAAIQLLQKNNNQEKINQLRSTFPNLLPTP